MPEPQARPGLLSSAEPPPAHPPRTGRRWSSIPRWAKAGAAAAVALLVASGLGLTVWGERPRPDWTMDGPHGAFPAAVASGAPKNPTKTIASFRYSPAVFEGVAIKALHDAESVIVSDLRSGRVYWTFTGHRRRVVAAALDENTGRLMAVWARHDHDGDMTEAPARVTMLDIRTGKVVWDRGIDRKAVIPDGFWAPNIEASAVIQIDGKVVALDPATGRVRWQIPDDCERSGLVATASTVIVNHVCHDDETVESFDATTGRRLWGKTFARWRPGREFARSLPVRVEALDHDRVAVWIRDHEAVYDARTGGELAVSRGAEGTVTRNNDLVFSGGVQVGTCWTDRAHKVVTGICANDVSSGRRLWTYWYPGEDEQYVLNTSMPVAAADGRVYSLSSDRGGESADRLTINDARTGAVLARIPLSLPEGLFQLGGVGDGVVRLRNLEAGSRADVVQTVVLGDGT
ncbi:PQQ-binding-like beta-propeller repeat protein [Actinomadura oligospora]|uniref:outer membrane protein assembly factor BamB family protein n=1 Tax=Actinomadura oligospora TaxID=111804 RepID=UPI00047D376A|nr:PQQ-binding-like beta-propeller repeat protein [Actinomadura oligospora]